MTCKKRMMKLITSITLFTFFYSSVLQQPLFAVTALVKENAQIQLLMNRGEQFVIPYRLGRVTDGALGDPGRLVVYVQDLHCNPEVQGNITRILHLLDSRYGIRKIFVEGAPEGKLDTAVFDTISDPGVREQVVRDLFHKGVLSGPEYYALKYKQDKLYGLEDWDLYSQNLERYRRIWDRREENAAAVAKVRRAVDAFKEKYLARDLARMERQFAGQTKNNRFLRLERLGEKTGEKVAAYPNLSRYVQMLKLNKHLRYRRLNEELKSYTQDLKHIVPMKDYLALTGKLQNDSLDEYYLGLYELAEKYGPDLRLKYPETGRFFAYLNLNYRINPLYLVEEEELFTDRVLERSAARLLDKDILFLSRMADSFSDFVTLKMPPQHFYDFKQGKDRWGTLLEKYFPYGEIAEALKLLNDEEMYAFYEVNFARNEKFVTAISGEKTELVSAPVAGPGFAPILERMAQFRDIDVIIAGGFHLDIVDSLKSRRQSCLAITPNVTGNFDGSIYEQLMSGTVDFSLILGSALSNPRIVLGTEASDNLITFGEIIAMSMAAQKSREEIEEEIARWKAVNAAREGVRDFRAAYHGGRWDVYAPGKDGKEALAFALDAEGEKIAVRAGTGKETKTVHFIPVDEIKKGMSLALQNARHTGRITFLITGAFLLSLWAISLVTGQPLPDPQYPLAGTAFFSGAFMFAPLTLFWGGIVITSPAKEMTDEVAQIYSELRACISSHEGEEPVFDREKLSRFLEKYSQVVGQQARFPVEGPWPVMKAIVQLSKAEEKKLLEFIWKTYKDTKRLLLVDALLLMLSEADDPYFEELIRDWLKKQAKNLGGRRVYDISPEISHWSGGLGPVMVFHGRGKKKLNADVVYIEPWYQLRKDRGNPQGDPLDYSDLGPTSLRNVVEMPQISYSVDVGNRKKVQVKVARGENDEGVPVYLIKDIIDDQGNSYFTRMLYAYREEDDPNDQRVLWEEFSAFFCKASAELVRILETERKEKRGDAWKGAVVHSNDGQTASLTAIIKSKYEHDPVMSKIISVFTTHTYKNRREVGRDMGVGRLRHFFEIPDKYLSSFVRRDYKGDPIVDYSGGGIRLADLVTYVSKQHLKDLEVVDPDARGIAVTNGAVPEMMAKVFREELLKKFPGADVQRPTPKQVEETKLVCKDLLNEVLERKDKGKIDTNRLLITYDRRLVDEKAGHKRAFTEENVREMVRRGANVVLFGADQGKGSRDILPYFQNLEAKLAAEGHPGRFIFVSSFTSEEKIKLLAASNIQVQDSDRGTGAAEFSEEDITANGGLQFSPPYHEGVILAQGLTIDFDNPSSRGNTIVPKGTSPGDYREAFNKAIDMWGKRRDVFYENSALSVRLNRIQRYLNTSAAYLRGYDTALEQMLDEQEEDRAVISRILAKIGNRSVIVQALLDSSGRGFEFSGSDMHEVSFGGDPFEHKSAPGLKGFLEKKEYLERKYGSDALYHHLKNGHFGTYLRSLVRGSGISEEMDEWLEMLNNSPAKLLHKDRRLTGFLNLLVSELEKSLPQPAPLGLSPADAFLSALVMQRPVSRQELKYILYQYAPFEWRYKDLQNGNEVTLPVTGGEGLKGFLDTLGVVPRERAKGESFNWSLRYHMWGNGNKAGTHESHILQYLDNLLTYVPGFEQEKNRLGEIAAELRTTGSTDADWERIYQLHQEAIALAWHIVRVIESQYHIQAVALGYKPGELPIVVEGIRKAIEASINPIVALAAETVRGIALSVFKSGIEATDKYRSLLRRVAGIDWDDLSRAIGVDAIAVWDTPGLVGSRGRHWIATKEIAGSDRKLLVSSVIIRELIRRISPFEKRGRKQLIEDFFKVYVDHQNDEDQAINDPRSLVFKLFSGYLQMGNLEPEDLENRTVDNFHAFIDYLDNVAAAQNLEEGFIRPAAEELGVDIADVDAAVRRLVRQESVFEVAREAAFAEMRSRQGMRKSEVARAVAERRAAIREVTELYTSGYWIYRDRSFVPKTEKWKDRSPLNYNELITFWLENAHEKPLSELRRLVINDFDGYLAYRAIADKLFPRIDDVIRTRQKELFQYNKYFYADLAQFLRFGRLPQAYLYGETDLAGKLDAFTRLPIERAVADASSAHGQNAPDTPEKVRTAARIIKDNFFTEAFKSEENWKYAVEKLRELSSLDPQAVREGLRHDFGEAKHTIEEYREILSAQLGSDGDAIVADLVSFADELKNQGKDKIVVVNATFSGGGVAEMWKTAGAILKTLGIDVEWQIVYPESSRFYDTTKKIHNAIQGVDALFSREELALWDEVNRANADILKGVFTDPRVARVFIEDPQVLPLVRHGKEINAEARLSWRLHIDVSGIQNRNDGAIQIWERMKQYLRSLRNDDVILFQPYLAPDDVAALSSSSFSQYPGIDLLAPKNARLTHTDMIEEIDQINKKLGTAIDPRKPTLVTGARFDYWKGLPTALHSFERVAQENHELQLVVFGNYANDDPEGKAHYGLLQAIINEMVQRNPGLKGRIHLVTNQTGRTVAALYRLAAEHKLPFIAFSLKEGFNLMVAEAAAQGAAVLVSEAGGLRRFTDQRDAWRVDIAPIVRKITDASRLYQVIMQDGKPSVQIQTEARELEEALTDTLSRALQGYGTEDYAKNYDEIAREGLNMAYRQSLMSMLRNYLSLAMGDRNTFKQVIVPADTVSKHLTKNNSGNIMAAALSRNLPALGVIRKIMLRYLSLPARSTATPAIVIARALIDALRGGEDQTGYYLDLFKAKLGGNEKEKEDFNALRETLSIEVYDRAGLVQNSDSYALAALERTEDGKKGLILHSALARALLAVGPPAPFTIPEFLRALSRWEELEQSALNDRGTLLYRIFSQYLAENALVKPEHRNADNFSAFVEELRTFAWKGTIGQKIEEIFGQYRQVNPEAARKDVERIITELAQHAVLIDYAKEVVYWESTRKNLSAEDALVLAQKRRKYLAEARENHISALQGRNRPLRIPARNYRDCATLWRLNSDTTATGKALALISDDFGAFQEYERLINELLPWANTLRSAYEVESIKTMFASKGFSPALAMTPAFGLMHLFVPARRGELERLRELKKVKDSLEDDLPGASPLAGTISGAGPVGKGLTRALKPSKIVAGAALRAGRKDSWFAQLKMGPGKTVLRVTPEITNEVREDIKILEELGVPVTVITYQSQRKKKKGVPEGEFIAPISFKVSGNDVFMDVIKIDERGIETLTLVPRARTESAAMTATLRSLENDLKDPALIPPVLLRAAIPVLIREAESGLLSVELKEGLDPWLIELDGLGLDHPYGQEEDIPAVWDFLPRGETGISRETLNVLGVSLNEQKQLRARPAERSAEAVKSYLGSLVEEYGGVSREFAATKDRSRSKGTGYMNAAEVILGVPLAAARDPEGGRLQVSGTIDDVARVAEVLEAETWRISRVRIDGFEAGDKGALGLSPLFVPWSKIGQALDVSDQKTKELEKMLVTEPDDGRILSEQERREKENAIEEYVKECYLKDKENQKKLDSFMKENPQAVSWAAWRLSRKYNESMEAIEGKKDQGIRQELRVLAYTQLIVYAQLESRRTKPLISIPVSIGEKGEVDAEKLVRNALILLQKGMGIAFNPGQNGLVVREALEQLCREITDPARGLDPRSRILVNTSRDLIDMVLEIAGEWGVSGLRPVVNDDDTAGRASVPAVEFRLDDKLQMGPEAFARWFEDRLRGVRADVLVIDLPAGVRLPSLGQVSGRGFDFRNILDLIAAIIPSQPPLTMEQSFDQGEAISRVIIRKYEKANPVQWKMMSKLLLPWYRQSRVVPLDYTGLLNTMASITNGRGFTDVAESLRSLRKQLGEAQGDLAQQRLMQKAEGFVHGLLSESLYRNYPAGFNKDLLPPAERERLTEILVRLAVRYDGERDGSLERLRSTPQALKAGIITPENVKAPFGVFYFNEIGDGTLDEERILDALLYLDALYQLSQATGKDKRLVSGLLKGLDRRILDYFGGETGAARLESAGTETKAALYNALAVIAQLNANAGPKLTENINDLREKVRESLARDLPQMLLLTTLSVFHDDAAKGFGEEIVFAEQMEKMVKGLEKKEGMPSPEAVLARLMIVRQTGTYAEVEAWMKNKNTLEALISRNDIPTVPLAIAAGLYFDLLDAEAKSFFKDIVVPAVNTSIEATKGIVSAA